MIYLTQLIYIKQGQEKIFDEFENVAISTISKYNGQLLFRVRPTENNFIGAHTETPYEIHVIGFKSEIDFENFKHDDERKRVLHLKGQSVESVLLIKGEKV